MTKRTKLDPQTRRQQLLDAAIRVFARKGYTAASINDIIEAGGVARGTFYLYFPGKREAFIAVVDDYRSRLERLIKTLRTSADQATPEKWQEKAEQNLRAWFEFFLRDRETTKIVLREANTIDPQFARKRKAIRELAKTFLAERFGRAQEAGLCRADLSPQVFSLFVMGMLDETVSSYILSSKQPNLDWLVEQWMKFELDGIRQRQ